MLVGKNEFEDRYEGLLRTGIHLWEWRGRLGRDNGRMYVEVSELSGVGQSENVAMALEDRLSLLSSRVYSCAREDLANHCVCPSFRGLVMHM